MIWIDGGTFNMGATEEQGPQFSSDELPVHSVMLDGFYMGETEVTQDLWLAVMGENPSLYKGGNRPVENVSWEDCQKFIIELNQLTNMSFRLPTEAEWEYAARGGSLSEGFTFAGSNNIDDVAWYFSNSYSTKHHDVASKTPNELGLYDMTGNVYEWCHDYYGQYTSDEQINPVGPETGDYHVHRGDCWLGQKWHCHVSSRNHVDSLNKSLTNGTIGMRLSMSKQ